MASTRRTRAVALTAATCLAGIALTATVSASSASHLRPRRTTTTTAATTTTTTTTTVPATGLTAPTNLRVTQLTSTSVTFQWDHSQGTTGGCTLPIAIYYVYVDGAYRGTTGVYGSPVGFVAGLQPGTTHTLAVQGRDNCSGRISPLSAPLVVTTPR